MDLTADTHLSNLYALTAVIRSLAKQNAVDIQLLKKDLDEQISAAIVNNPELEFLPISKEFLLREMDPNET